jgi:hypothetical protein
MPASNPYVDLPPSAFWRSAVSDVSPLEIADLYQPRFALTRQTVIATAGSCFARHIGNRLKAAGFNFLDVEPPPPLLPEALWREFSYGMYSGRYGNVYSIRQLLQMFQRAYLTASSRRRKPFGRSRGASTIPFVQRSNRGDSPRRRRPEPWAASTSPVCAGS